MFGHDDKKQTEEEHVTGDAGPLVQPGGSTPPDDNLVGVGAGDEPASTPPASSTNSDDDDDDISKIVDDINASTDDGSEKPEPEPKSEPSEEPADSPTLNETPAELQEIKKSALQELSPLLDELDQTAEEKLNILMMTIQATDDQGLLPKALEQAKKIADKKARAEAMLDIIQEINYFTKKK